jgi:hypothetical protein
VVERLRIVRAEVVRVGTVLGSTDGRHHVWNLGIVEREAVKEGVIGFAYGFGFFLLLCGVEVTELVFDAEVVQEGHDGVAFVRGRGPGAPAHYAWLCGGRTAKEKAVGLLLPGGEGYTSDGTGREDVMRGTWGRVMACMGYWEENMGEPKPPSQASGKGTEKGRRRSRPDDWWRAMWPGKLK